MLVRFYPVIVLRLQIVSRKTGSLWLTTMRLVPGIAEHNANPISCRSLSAPQLLAVSGGSSALPSSVSERSLTGINDCARHND